jgi:hypothetical protein
MSWVRFKKSNEIIYLGSSTVDFKLKNKKEFILTDSLKNNSLNIYFGNYSDTFDFFSDYFSDSIDNISEDFSSDISSMSYKNNFIYETNWNPILSDSHFIFNTKFSDIKNYFYKLFEYSFYFNNNDFKKSYSLGYKNKNNGFNLLDKFLNYTYFENYSILLKYISLRGFSSIIGFGRKPILINLSDVVGLKNNYLKKIYQKVKIFFLNNNKTKKIKNIEKIKKYFDYCSSYNFRIFYKLHNLSLDLFYLGKYTFYKKILTIVKLKKKIFKVRIFF